MEIKCINTRLLTRGDLKARIIRVESPTFFWIHLENSREDYEEMFEELARRMTRKSHFLHQFSDHIRLDTIVAIREGKRWQRGIITQIKERNIVTVSLRDWGRTIQRSVFDCYVLEDRFRNREWQAIPCALAHIKPTGVRIRWPRKVIQLSRLLLEKREGWFNIRRSLRDEAAVVNVRLRPESEDEMSDLQGLLIRMGCAQHIHQSIIETIPSIL